MEGMISIVVPIYNVEQYLDRCIESIVNQTYTNLEIILVDDGSPDGCPEMCDNWEKMDERIRVIHKENGGLSDARNAGMDYAHGDYLLLVDSDDYIEKDACERLLDTMKKTDVDFVVGVAREIRPNGISYQRRSTIESVKTYSSSEFIIRSIDSNEWYAPAVLNLYKKDFLEVNALRFRIGLLHEDMEFMPRLYLTAKSISYLDYAFYNYVIRENSIMTTGNCERKNNSLKTIFASWKMLFDEVEDIELRRKLYGVLIKHYLYSCRVLKNTTWLISGVDFGFSLKYALNFRERIKVLFFHFFPRMYIKEVS